MNARSFLPFKTITVLVIIFSLVGVTTSAFRGKDAITGDDDEFENISKDSIESVKAFAGVYKVLMSPRCMNCHPAGDIPLQGDDSHIHAMFPKRGKDGKGLYAMKCSNCHQPANWHYRSWTTTGMVIKTKRNYWNMPQTHW